jgi:RsiW-degrading membrane proteinase PrsW (M82 family)
MDTGVRILSRSHRSDLHQTRFYQPQRPAYWLYLIVVGATGAVSIAQQTFFRRLSAGGWVLSWALLLLYALPVFLLVYFLDLYEHEPIGVVVASLIWGAVAATTLAGVANAGWGLVVARVGGPAFAARWTAALTAPFVEETLKGLGVVMIYLIVRDEFDDVMDGFVYGAVCGLGFAIVEDVFYFMSVFGGRPGGVLRGFLLRVVASGLYSHVLYTGLVGMGIGYVVSRRTQASRARRIWVCAGLCALAVFGHFLWDSPLFDLFPTGALTVGTFFVSVVAAAVKGLPLLIFVSVAIYLARKRERRWLDQSLANEVGGEGISESELRTLESPKRRRLTRREMRRRAGRGAASLLRRLQREQVNLAMIRSRVAVGDDPALLRQRALCRSLRDALQAIPGAAPAETSAHAERGSGSG